MATKDTVLVENDEDDKKQDEELVITETKPQESSDKDDERAKKSTDEDDIDPDNPDAGDEREAIRERRRLEKLERKERREKAITRDKLELDFLRKRNDDLERRISATEQRVNQRDVAGIDQSIQAALREAEMADQVIAKAVAAGNGEDVIKAMKYRDDAKQRAQQLAYAKQQASQQPAQVQNALPKAVAEHAADFMEDNPWYDAQGRDEASAVVLAIDSALAREGFDPNTEDYWDELRTRVEKRLPDKVKPVRKTADKSAERTARGGPAVGSGREHAPSSTRKEVYISPERKQALVDAGVWDDPTLRMKYVRRYAEYDKTNRA